MSVSNLELSKRLYELSGWGTDSREGRYFDRNYPVVPNYDLGYMLRKLENRQYNTSLYHSVTQNQWRCMYKGYDFGKTADTPEDATAKLCIALFESGILKKEDNV